MPVHQLRKRVEIYQPLTLPSIPPLKPSSANPPNLNWTLLNKRGRDAEDNGKAQQQTDS